MLETSVAGRHPAKRLVPASAPQCRLLVLATRHTQSSEKLDTHSLTGDLMAFDALVPTHEAEIGNNFYEQICALVSYRGSIFMLYCRSPNMGPLGYCFNLPVLNNLDAYSRSELNRNGNDLTAALREAMTTQEGKSRDQAVLIPRATRYEIVTVIQYRAEGEKKWRAGILKNMSITGMLIVAEEPLDEGTKIEMRFSLPIELKDKYPADVHCRGIIIRSEQEVTAAGLVNIGAKISFSRLCRRKIQLTGRALGTADSSEF